MFNNLTGGLEGAEFRPLEICLYGQAGMGKTTFAATTKNPLILSFEAGVDRAMLPTSINDYNITWDADKAVLQIMQHFSNTDVQRQLRSFDAVVIDTIGAMFTSIGDELIRQNPRMGNPGGGLSMQGWGAVAKQVKSFIQLIKAIGLNVIYLAQEDQRVIEDVLKYKPDVPGNVVYKHLVENCDMIGRIYSENKQRKINFESNDVQLGKNFINLQPAFVPHYQNLESETPNMAYIIESAQKQKAANRAAILEKIAANNAAAEEVKEISEPEKLAQHFKDNAPTPAQIPVYARKWNELLSGKIELIKSAIMANKMLEWIPLALETGLANSSVKPLKKQLMAKANGIGIAYSKEKALFVAPEKKQKEATNE